MRCKGCRRQHFYGLWPEEVSRVDAVVERDGFKAEVVEGVSTVLKKTLRRKAAFTMCGDGFLMPSGILLKSPLSQYIECPKCERSERHGTPQLKVLQQRSVFVQKSMHLSRPLRTYRRVKTSSAGWRL